MPATRRKLRDVVDEDEASLPLTPSHHTQAGAVASTTPVRTPHLARRSAAASASSPYARTPNSSHRAVVARTPNNNNNRLSVRPRTSEPPQSPAMRAIGGFLGLISPFSRLNAKRSAAFGTPEAESAQEDTAQEEGGSRSLEDQMMHEDLPTTPGQQFLTAGPSRTSGNADYNPFTDRRYGPNVADGGGMRISQSTPAGLASFNAHQHEPTLPQPPHFERRGLSPHPLHSQRSSYDEAASQQQHAEQEARAAAAAEAAQHEREPQGGDSPLSRNYELLSRFFAEKATPGEGQTLSEIEIQGCVRLLEESLAYSSGEQDLERMRAAGAFRENQLHAWSAAGGSSARNAAAALRRSPSLPFGAAAGEGWHGGALLSSAAHQSRPSTSFLAPRPEGDKHNASSTDAKFAKSLANSFSPAALAASGRGAAASSSSEARRRPLYLGPGLGRGSVSALARRAARSAALARPSTASLREAPRAAVPVPAGTGEDSTKRRRVQVPDAAADAPATFIQPSTPTKDALPSTTSQQATPASNAAAPPAAATPTRSATANAILSIIAASPLPPPASPRARRSEHVNPYEATTRGAARKSAEPSSGSGLSARAKALRAAKEDARKRKADAEETRRKASIEPRKETALERIERTAPLTPAKKQRASAPMPPKENEKEDLPPVEPLDGSNDETMASAEDQQEEEDKAKEKAARKARATEEALRRMKAMQQSSTSSSSDSSKDKSDSASSSAAAAAAPAAKPGVASVPFTFTAPKVAQAFAPKKPSPLSLAFKPTPDSPGSSSESEDARSAGASTSQFASAVGSAKEAPPKLAFNFGASASMPAPAAAAKPSEAEKEKETSKAKNAAPLFSFGAKSQKDTTSTDEEMSSPSAPAVAESTTPAAPPKTNSFNFGAPTSTAASTSVSQPASPRAQALSVPSTSLPTFTLPLSTPSSSTSTAEAGTKAKAAAFGDLPTFSFHFDASNKASLKVDVTAAPSSSASASASAPISATASEDGASSPAASVAGSSSGLLASGAGEGEEGEETKHEVRGKVWALQKGAWKDLGVGLVKLKAAEDGKRRLLVRNEVTGKPTVNFNLYAALTIKQEANVITFTGFAEGQPMNYRTKIKTAEGAAELKAAMEQEAALCK